MNRPSDEEIKKRIEQLAKEEAARLLSRYPNTPCRVLVELSFVNGYAEGVGASEKMMRGLRETTGG